MMKLESMRITCLIFAWQLVFCQILGWLILEIGKNQTISFCTTPENGYTTGDITPYMPRNR